MNSLLLVIPVAISLVSFVGLAFVYLRGSADKGTIESQKRLIDAQGGELEELTRRVTRAETRVRTVETENNVLRKAVTHVEEIVEMQATLDRNHSEQIAVLGRILVALEALAA